MQKSAAKTPAEMTSTMSSSIGSAASAWVRVGVGVRVGVRVRVRVRVRARARVRVRNNLGLANGVVLQTEHDELKHDAVGEDHHRLRAREADAPSVEEAGEQRVRALAREPQPLVPRVHVPVPPLGQGHLSLDDPRLRPQLGAGARTWLGLGIGLGLGLG